MSEWSLVCGTLYLPPFLSLGNRMGTSEGAKESRVQKSCGCPSISACQYLIEHTHRQREGRWLKGGWMFPRCRHAVRGPEDSVPSRAESWGFLEAVGVCAWGCDAWVVCHSGWGCGCCGEGRRGSGRIRWPFHWAPAGRSLSALSQFGEGGREKKWERYIRR